MVYVWFLVQKLLKTNPFSLSLRQWERGFLSLSLASAGEYRIPQRFAAADAQNRQTGAGEYRIAGRGPGPPPLAVMGKKIAPCAAGNNANHTPNKPLLRWGRGPGGGEKC